MLRYFRGAFWLILASLISVLNDVCMKLETSNYCDIVFWRFFSATLVLLPFVIYYRPHVTLGSLRVHGIRSILFGISMFFYLVALKILPISLVNAINFSIPIWVVILACIFLEERWDGRLLSTFLGVVGVYVALIPVLQSGSLIFAGLLILGALGFAILDVFNKYLLNKDESMIMMLFGSSFGITLLYLPFISWKLPCQPYLFIWLGLGANLLLYCYLKAWESCDISAIQPLKYIEFPLAIYFGKSIFHETTSWYVFLGLGIMLIGIFINMRLESRRR